MERREKRLNYLLGPIPKYGYNASGGSEPLTNEEIWQELASENVNTTKVFSMNWIRQSIESPEKKRTLRLVILISTMPKLPTHICLFARATRLKSLENRPQLQVCPRYHRYPNINAYNRHARYGICATNSYSGSCSTPVKCLNCAGPHQASSPGYPSHQLCAKGLFRRAEKIGSGLL